MEIFEIKSFEEYLDFILELADNPLYYDPHYAYVYSLRISVTK